MKRIALLCLLTLILGGCANMPYTKSGIQVTPPTDGCAPGAVRPDGSCAQVVDE